MHIEHLFLPNNADTAVEIKVHLQVLSTCNYENHRKNIKPYLRVRKPYFGRNDLTCLLSPAFYSKLGSL